MVRYLLDTNICIYIIKKQPPSVFKKLETLLPEQVFLSSITVSELVYGVEKSQHQQKNFKALGKFIQPFSVVAFDQAAAVESGKLRAHLERKGQPIGVFDLMIAAHAQSLDVKLVTNNEREFSRIPGLRVENWVD